MEEVLNGSLSSNLYKGIRGVQLHWRVDEQDIVTNRTKMHFWFAGSGSDIDRWYVSSKFEIIVNGVQIYYSTDRIELNYRTEITLKEGFWLPHNPDGTAHMDITIKASIYNWGSPPNVSGTGSFDLKRIPRKAVINSVSSFNDEQNPYIAYSNPAGNAASISVRMEDINSVELVGWKAGSSSETGVTYSLTEVERNSLRNRCSNANSMNVRFRLRTAIGSASFDSLSEVVTLSIVNATPTLSPSIWDSNKSVTDLLGTSSSGIKTLSTISYSSGVSVKKGASLSSITVTCGDSKSTSIDGSFARASTGTVTFSVIDSRGNAATATKSMTLYDYVSPSVAISSAKIDLWGILTVHFSGRVRHGMYGPVSAKVLVQYRVNGGPWITDGLDTAYGSEYRFDGRVSVGGYAQYTNYRIEIMVSDWFMGAVSAPRDVESRPNPATITGAPNFSDGTDPKISINNPAGPSAILKACIQNEYGNILAPYRSVPYNSNTYAFKLNADERNSFWDYCKYAKSRPVKFVLRCEINGNITETYKDSIFSIVDANPSVSISNLRTSDANTKTFFGNENEAVYGCSDITYSLSINAMKNATIDKIIVTCGDSTLNADNGTFYDAKSGTISVKVIDSRKFEATASASLTMYPRTSPSAKITKAVINDDGKMELRFGGQITRNYGNKNSGYDFQYKIDHGPWVSINSDTSSNGGIDLTGDTGYTVSGFILNTNNNPSTPFEHAKSYDITVRAIEYFGGDDDGPRTVARIPVLSVGDNRIHFAVGDSGMITGPIRTLTALSKDRAHVIPIGGDLNDYTSPGMYGVPYLNDNQNIKNLPYRSPGLLIVSSAIGTVSSGQEGSYILQEYQDYWGYVNAKRLCYVYGNTEGNWSFGDWYMPKMYKGLADGVERNDVVLSQYSASTSVEWVTLVDDLYKRQDWNSIRMFNMHDDTGRTPQNGGNFHCIMGKTNNDYGWFIGISYEYEPKSNVRLIVNTRGRGVWGDWVLSPQNWMSAADTVAYLGTSGNWIYRKWDSGLAECWARVKFENCPRGYWGSMFSYGINGSRLRFPFDFTETPITVVTAECPDSQYRPNGWLATRSEDGISNTQYTPSYQMVRPTDAGAAMNIVLCYHVLGRWK